MSTILELPLSVLELVIEVDLCSLVCFCDFLDSFQDLLLQKRRQQRSLRPQSTQRPFRAPMRSSRGSSSRRLGSLTALRSNLGYKVQNAAYHSTLPSTNGSKTITKVVPDTITSWIITGFSMNSKEGLGLTKQPSKLTVFMPFFVALNLPYSVKRGESVAIEVIVFNYGESDLTDVFVTLHSNSDFRFINDADKTQKITAKANRGTSLRFNIRPAKVGYIELKIDAISSLAGDKIKRFLLVEAEGVTEYVNEAVFVDLRSVSEVRSSFYVQIPPSAIEDSVRIEVSVIGDLLGPTIENLGKLM
jgi:CD109 antigen